MFMRLGHCRQCFNFGAANWVGFTHSSSFSKRSFYQILDVQPSSEPKQIKDNFYKLSKEFHPDINKDDPLALTKFKEIVEAYEVLSNPVEKRKYDDQYGFRTKPKTQIHKRPTRRFHRGGLNEKGQFVDDYDPPVMREIQYDLSPEKMQKVWERYKERWDKIDEIERIRELKKKKLEFRKNVDERRANMKNMSPAEREDFLFKLRMLNKDVGKPIGENEFSGNKKQSENEQSSNKDANTKAENTKEESSTQENRFKQWMERESGKVDMNLNWKEKLRDQVKEQLKAEAEKMKTGKAKAEKFVWEHMSIPQTDEEATKRARDEFKKYQENMWDFGDKDDLYSYNDKNKNAKNREHWNPREDPLMKGVNMDDPANWNDWLNTSFERSKERVEEIKTARPFTYHQQSIRYGVAHNSEVKFSKYMILIPAILVVFLFYLDNVTYREQDKDNVADLEKAVSRLKKDASV